MNAYNLSPLFRTAIGFDRLARLADAAAASDVTYPPYNIEKTGEDSYRLVMAVAGFGPDDIEMTVKDNFLHIAGKASTEPKSDVLYRGIAGRAFERRFALAEHIVVENAELVNGLLSVGLRRVVPEALKPRRIAVNAGVPQIAAVAGNGNGTASKAA
jgi:molecular chaperone IbpA